MSSVKTLNAKWHGDVCEMPEFLNRDWMGWFYVAKASSLLRCYIALDTEN